MKKLLIIPLFALTGCITPYEAGQLTGVLLQTGQQVHQQEQITKQTETVMEGRK
jgi:hypothetical protein